MKRRLPTLYANYFIKHTSLFVTESKWPGSFNTIIVAQLERGLLPSILEEESKFRLFLWRIVCKPDELYFIKWKKNKGTVIKAKTTWNKSSPKSVQKIMKQRVSIQTDEWSQVIALCCLMKDNVPFCSKKDSIVLSTTWSPLAAKVGRGHRTIDTHRSAKTYKQKKKKDLDLKKEWGAS